MAACAPSASGRAAEAISAVDRPSAARSLFMWILHGVGRRNWRRMAGFISGTA
jgi:hypothetical protein